MSLQNSLNNCVNDIIIKFNNGLLKATMESWNASWPSIFNEGIPEQRTVRNWYVPSTVVELSIATPATNSNLQDVISIITKTLEAAIAAENAARITPAQATNLENTYNSIWP